MNTSEVSDALGEISDAELLEKSEAELSDAGYRLLGSADFDGIAVRSPSHVNLDRVSGWPLLFVVDYSTVRSREVGLAQNAIVVCFQADSGLVRFAPLYAPRPEKIPVPRSDRPMVPQDESAQPTRSREVAMRDLRALFEPPWPEGSYAVGILSFDWASNAAVTRLTGGDATPISDLPRRKASEVASAWRTPVSLSSPDVPSFVAGPQTPTLAGPGAAIASGEKDVVYGRISLASDDPMLASWRENDSDEFASVVPGVILLARKGILSPIVLPVEIPIRAGELQGYFAHELGELRGVALEPGDYQAILLAGRHWSDPVAVTIAR